MLPSCLTSQRSAYTTPPLPWWLWRAQGMSAVAYGYGQYKRLEALHRWCVGAEDYARATCCQEAFSYTFSFRGALLAHDRQRCCNYVPL